MGLQEMLQHRSHPRPIRKLQDALGDQICAALDEPSVVEIMLNPNGKLFIERLGHGIAPAGDMSPGAAEIVIGSVAHALNSHLALGRLVAVLSFPITQDLGFGAAKLY